MHRTLAPRYQPLCVAAEGESSAQRRSTVIRLRIPPRRSTRLTPPTLISTAAEAEDIVLQDTLQVSLAEQKSHDEDESRENVEQVKDHLMAEEIEKLVEGSENDAENVVEYVEKYTEKLQELTVNNPTPSSYIPSSSSPSHNLSVANQLLSLFKAKHRCNKSFFQELQGRYGYLFEHLLTKFMPRRKSYFTVHPTQATPASAQRSTISIVYNNERPVPQLQITDYLIRIGTQFQIKRMYMSTLLLDHTAFRPRDQDDPHDDAHPERENSVKRQKTYEHGMIKLRGSSSGQVYESKPGPSTSGNQEQTDDFDFWTDSYAIDDDVILNEKVSQ
ncbi:hypothetical protein Tco_0152937 [Tanacetum coccineum]